MLCSNLNRVDPFPFVFVMVLHGLFSQEAEIYYFTMLVLVNSFFSLVSFAVFVVLLMHDWENERKRVKLYSEYLISIHFVRSTRKLT